MAGRDPLGPPPALGALTEAPPSSDARANIESLLGRPFARPELLREALTHRSAANVTRSRTEARSGAGSNERLEFIGDRVLGLLIAEWLIERFPQEQEGELGRRLAYLVSRPVLAGMAEDVGIGAALDVAAHEARAGVHRAASVLADAIEAVLGAAYLDCGLEAPRRFVRAVWAKAMTAQTLPPKDPKTELQEWLLARGLPLPGYTLDSADGPPHAPRFVIRVLACGKTGFGAAGNKRAAESLAAAELLAQLRCL